MRETGVTGLACPPRRASRRLRISRMSRVVPFLACCFQRLTHPTRPPRFAASAKRAEELGGAGADQLHPRRLAQGARGARGRLRHSPGLVRSRTVNFGAPNKSLSWPGFSLTHPPLPWRRHPRRRHEVELKFEEIAEQLQNILLKQAVSVLSPGGVWFCVAARRRE